MDENKKKETKSKICKAIRIGCGAGLFVAGWVISDKYTQKCVSVGLMSLHDQKVLKFFDPKTNEEIDVDAATEIMKNIAKEGH